MTKRLNIVVVVFEQFSALADPNYAECPVDAPALRELAGRAVRFDRAYCNAPVCGPSRLSLLTGRFAGNIDAFDNGSILPAHVPTFAHMLDLAGYRTALCGRMHIHGLDQHRGFEERLCSELINPLPCMPADWPGRMEPIRPLPLDSGGPYEPRFSSSPIYQHDRYVTEQSCDFLRRLGDDNSQTPFALLAGYLSAHSDFGVCPELEPLYHKYIRRDLPVPPFTRDDYERLPEHIRRLHQYHRADQRIFSTDYHRHELALYLARVEYADRQIGRILACLEESGLADRTAVIVTADHGEMMGHHGLWGKMNFYEPAVRVPLYIRVPGVSAGIVSQSVSLVDLLPTIAELTGAEVSFPVDGRSLLPLLEDPSTPSAGPAIFSEYHGYLSPSSMYMAMRGQLKYCHYLREPCELYDLSSDPGECRNLVEDPAYAAARDELLGDIQRRVDIEALERRIAEHNAQRDTVAKAIERSEILAAAIRHRIAAFRNERDEPWWDGGKYIGQWDPPALNPWTDLPSADDQPIPGRSKLR